MSTEQPAFPLSWPLGWPRTKSPERSRFGEYNRKPTIAAGRDAVTNQLRMLGVQRVVISTNIALRRDGLPYSNQKEPLDKGVAVYFELKKKACALPCDKWNTVGDNLWAIAKHLEALRGQDRWGVGTVERAFAGYAALPAPGDAEARNCWTELGIAPGSPAEIVNAVYRTLSQQRHPDRGGTHEAMASLNKAREEALAATGGKA